MRAPADAWFTRVLLYWDRVGLIVPGRMAQDVRRVGLYTAQLIQQRLLLPITPDGEVGFVGSYLQPFIDLIGADPLIDWHIPFEARDTVPVHTDKTGTQLGKYLQGAGLARHASGPAWEGWFEVDARVAS